MVALSFKMSDLYLILIWHISFMNSGVSSHENIFKALLFLLLLLNSMLSPKELAT